MIFAFHPIGPCGSAYLFGDPNFDYASPRGAGEARLAEALDDFCARSRLAALMDVGNTYASGDALSRIDVAAVPLQQSSIGPRKFGGPRRICRIMLPSWRGKPLPSAGGPCVCSPMAMRNLPDSSLRDVRLRYAQLALVFRFCGSAIPCAPAVVRRFDADECVDSDLLPLADLGADAVAAPGASCNATRASDVDGLDGGARSGLEAHATQPLHSSLCCFFCFIKLQIRIIFREI